MRQSLEELKAEGWEVTEVPFNIAISPDGQTVGMKCMTCHLVIKGILVAHGGLVQCRNCSRKTASSLISLAVGRGIVNAIIEVLKKRF